MIARFSLALAAWLALAPAGLATTFEGRCVSMHDGDTMRVQLGDRQERVRLVGIDAPEMAQKPWGATARDFARSIALNQPVRLETDVQERDHYGRLLAYVHVGKRFLNLELVKAGHANILTIPPNVAHASEFLQAQRLARSQGLGIWDPRGGLRQSPEDFRRAQRQKRKDDAHGRRHHEAE